MFPGHFNLTPVLPCPIISEQLLPSVPLPPLYSLVRTTYDELESLVIRVYVRFHNGIEYVMFETAGWLEHSSVFC